MSLFSYVGYDSSGKKVKDFIDASSIENAIAILEQQGLMVETIKPKKVAFARNIDNSLLATLSRNLALYLKSGISLVRAVSLLKSNYTNKKRVYEFLEYIESSLKKGDSFYKVLKEQKYFVIPNFYLFTIDVSEKISGLGNALDELAGLIQSSERIKRDIVKAFIYPSFIFLLAIGIVNFMLTSIVPQIVGMFEQSNAQLPTITVVTLALSNFVQSFGWLLFVGVFVAIGAFVASYKLVENFKYRVDSAILYIPLVKDMIITYELSRFSSIAALLLDKGIPYAKALNFAAKTFQNSKLMSIFEQASSEIIEGQSLSKSLASQNSLYLPKDFINAVAIGEESSHLSYSLKMIGDLFEQKNKDKIDIMLSLLEPVLMLFIGGIVGFIVISMMLPIFSLTVG